MFKQLFFVVYLLLLSSFASAAPFVISDPLATGVTQCGVFVDTSAKVTIPVTVVVTPPGNICKFDLVGVIAGAHTVKMTAIITDPVFGSKESAQSLPLAFTVPTVPAAPSGLLLTP